jgi:hypothetical protein
MTMHNPIQTSRANRQPAIPIGQLLCSLRPHSILLIFPFDDI